MSTTFASVVNNFATSLATAYVSGSSLVVASGAGADLVARLASEGQPSLSPTNWIRLTVDNGTDQTVFKVTGRSGDTLTVALLEGTVPAGGFAIGSLAQCRWTSGAIREIQTAVNALETTGASVSSVALSVPTGLSVSGSPITSTGTLAVTLGVSGILKGSSGSIVAASAGTDYADASHSHAASDVTSGTMATARLGSGTASASTFLRGDQSWASIPAATPGGSSGTIQYNNAGAFGGFGSWDGTTFSLASGQSIQIGTGTSVTQAVLKVGSYTLLATYGSVTNYFAGVSCGNAGTTGTNNVAVGTNTFKTSTTGSFNTILGDQAGRLGTSINSCVFVGSAAGYAAGSSAGTASQAVLIGASAAGNATSVSLCAIVGAYNANAATSLANCQAVGAYNAYSAASPGSFTAVGSYALYSATTLTNSIGIGHNAGAYCTSSTSSVFIGRDSGTRLTGAANGVTFLGAYAGSASPTPTALSYAIGLGAYAQPPADQYAAIGGTGSAAVALLIATRGTPADGDLAAGQLAIWFDATIGATKVKFKGKDTGGTVRTGELALT